MGREITNWHTRSGTDGPGRQGRADAARLPTLRRRQPLLRTARRVHAPPRPRSTGQRGVQVRHRRATGTARASCSWEGRVNRFSPEPDVRPDHRPRLPRPVVPGPGPGGHRPAHAPAGRAAGPATPSTGTARHGCDVLDRAGPRDAVHARSRRWAVGSKQALQATTFAATMASLDAFNRWLEEDWGYDHEGRHHTAAPMLSLADPDAARRRGRPGASGAARGSCTCGPHRSPPVRTARGTLARPPVAHDPVWARLAEAGASRSPCTWATVATRGSSPRLWGGSRPVRGVSGARPMS
ncbi:MAG: hypothetical protein KatS3mg009_3075 [Acidimicrobiia bacterium]|nr:MAG: hypothetical protein KatS3mg009_3075 [Acidimicrobiia bacterium]